MLETGTILNFKDGTKAMVCSKEVTRSGSVNVTLLPDPVCFSNEMSIDEAIREHAFFLTDLEIQRNV